MLIINRCSLLLLLCLTLAACVTTTSERFKTDTLDDNTRKRVDLALGYFERQDYTQTKRVLLETIERNPQAVDAYNLLAQVYIREGEPELASKQFAIALGIAPKNTRLRMNYGGFLYRQGDLKKAESQWQQASKDTDYDKRADVFVNLGRVQLRLQQTASAKKSFQKALLLKPSHALAWLEVADMQFTEANYENAQDALQRYSRLRGHSARSLWLTIQVEQLVGDKNTAASLALLLKNRFPESEQYQQYQQQRSH